MRSLREDVGRRQRDVGEGLQRERGRALDADDIAVAGWPFMAGQSGNPGGRPKGLERLAREIVGGGTDLMQFYRDVFDGKPFMRKVVQLLPLRKEHQWGGEVLFYICPGCRRPRRDLYPWQVIDGRLDRDLKPRCRECAGLRYLTQGIPGGESAPACAISPREYPAVGPAPNLGIRGRCPTLGWSRRSSQARSSSCRNESPVSGWPP